MEKKISVVIPTYRRPQLLIRCMEALADQHFPQSDYEVIIVSDGPDQATAAAVQGANKNRFELTFIQPEEKRGPAAARNLGWLRAKGKLIAFTDDDCIPDADWLENIWRSWHGEDEVAFTGKVIVPLPPHPTDYELNTCNLETAEFVTANCVCSKKALLKTGGFDERFKTAWREDSDLHFKLLLHNIPVRKIPAVVVHPVRKATWGISLKEEKKGIFNALLYKKYPSLYSEKIKAKAPWNYYASIASAAGVMTGIALHSEGLTASSLLCWVALLSWFSARRLSSTSRSFKHVFEMIVTSAAIPFVSVYYQFYGALKYRVLFL